MDYFAELGYHVFALNLRGHGGSAIKGSLKFAKFKDYSDDLEQAVERVETAQGKKPILVGHSLGGMLIQKYIETETVPAAVLISTPTAKSLRQATRKMFWRQPGAVAGAFLTFDTDKIYHRRSIIRSAFFTASLNETSAEEFCRRIESQPESTRVFLDILRIKFRTPAVRSPMLLIGGGQDNNLKRQTFYDNAAIYGLEPVILEDMPHDMMLEENWQNAADLIADWLKRQGL
jgi:alpha-beta hydrolase superfamily lysophospholipase